MVRLKAKKIRNNTYYYLEHATRKGNKVKKKEVYLGKKIPQDVEELKEKLLADIRKENWYQVLDRIREEYLKETKLMPGSSRKKEMENFAIRFTYDTQKIEGSKLTLRETANLLERGITPKDRPINDVREAEVHKKLFQEVLTYRKDLTLNSVLEWHRRLFQETKPDIAGKIRKTRIGISGSKFMPPLPVEVYPMLQDFFRWFERSKDRLHPVELAAIVHLKFVTIHPFADGNGRISRLMMNFVLHKKKYPMLNIPYEGRDSYYNALERSQVRKQDDIFVQWFIRKYVKVHKTYLSG